MVKNSVLVHGIISLHQQWRQQLLSAILRGQVPTVETDPGRCSFGKWLNSSKIKDPAILTLISNVSEVHERMHRSAVEIQDHIRAGKGAQGALKIFQEKVVPLSIEVIEGLQRIRAAYEDSEIRSLKVLLSLSFKIY